MLLDDIAEYLIAMGAVSTLWPIWRTDLPDEIDQGIALFETGGFPPDTLGRENVMVKFMVQIRGARQDYVTPRAKWEEVFNLLLDAQQTAGSPVLLPGYIFIQPLHDGPHDLGSDAKGRVNLTSNWRVKKARS